MGDPHQEPRVAVVTGAAGLIGRQICVELLDQGWVVIGLDVTAVDVDGVSAFSVDVSDPVAMSEVGRWIASRHAHVTCLIHAAALTGRAPGRKLGGMLTDLSVELWQEMLQVNLTSALICVQQLIDLLRRASSPKIILVGSIQGLVPTVGSGAYGVSKVGLGGLVRQLAAELAEDAITVNLVSPGPIADREEQGRLGVTEGEGPTPLRRFGLPREVARAIVLLLDDAFGYMTGVTIPIDGGEHLRPRQGPRRSHPSRPTSQPNRA